MLHPGSISLAPFIACCLLYCLWKPQTFNNYGELPIAREADPQQMKQDITRLVLVSGDWLRKEN